MRDTEPADTFMPPRFLEELHATARTIPCAYCGAQIGQPCINRAIDSHPPTRVPHATRIAAAEETPF